MAKSEGANALKTSLLLAAAMLITPNVGAFARTYTNATFGLQVEMPMGKTICTTEDGESDRGFIVLWHTTKCPPADGTTGIYVFVEYNALGWRSTPEGGKLICIGGASRPSPFVVSGFRFYQCKSRTDSGRISLAYFVLRNRMLSSPDNQVNYGVSLICPNDNCQDLLPVTRWIFSHMKFIKQD
jgi:hypothetical protein